ncbi:entericidin A/B family lipoprotein [Rhodospirillaceae bacterium SYSU D60014]
MSAFHFLLRPVLFLFMLAATAGALSACNTMEGLGEDTQSAGEALEEEAE